MLNKSGKSGGHPCLIPDFSRKAFSFSPLSVMLPWVCHKHLWLCWDMFLYTYFGIRVYHEWMLNFCQMLFMHLLRWSCGFCLFFCWCGVSHWLICVCWLKHPYYPGVCPISSRCMSFFVCCWGWLLIFCWGFLHLYVSNILDCNSLFWQCLCLVLVSG